MDEDRPSSVILTRRLLRGRPVRVLAAVLVAVLVRTAAASPDETIPTAEEILANPLDDSAYVDDVRCLATGRYRQVDIVSDRILVFRGRGGRAWINLLPRRCPGLRRDMVLAIQVRGARACSRDQFRGMPRLSPDAATGFCSLGVFHRVEADNLDAIRRALRAGGANTTVAKTVRSTNSQPELASGQQFAQPR